MAHFIRDIRTESSARRPRNKPGNRGGHLFFRTSFVQSLIAGQWHVLEVNKGRMLEKGITFIHEVVKTLPKAAQTKSMSTGRC